MVCSSCGVLEGEFVFEQVQNRAILMFGVGQPIEEYRKSPTLKAAIEPRSTDRFKWSILHVYGAANVGGQIPLLPDHGSTEIVTATDRVD